MCFGCILIIRSTLTTPNQPQNDFFTHQSVNQAALASNRVTVEIYINTYERGTRNNNNNAACFHFFSRLQPRSNTVEVSALRKVYRRRALRCQQVQITKESVKLTKTTTVVSSVPSSSLVITRRRPSRNSLKVTPGLVPCLSNMSMSSAPRSFNWRV